MAEICVGKKIMKKLIMILLAITFSLNISAQNYKNDGKPYYFYCQMTATKNLTGVLRLELEWDNKEDNEFLRDENGKKIEFVSVVDMLNYMSRRGWELNKTYVVQNVIRFLFRKLVTNDDEAKEGLYFKSDFKKQ